MRLLSFCFILWAAQLTGLAQPNFWYHTASPNGTFALATHPDGTLFAGNTFGVFRSTDNSESWEKVYDQEAQSIAINRDGSVFIATSNSGIQRSTDLGVTWFGVNSGLPVSAFFFVAMSPDSDLYIGTWGKIYRSTDFGVSWNQVGGQITTETVNAVAFPIDGVVLAGASTGIYKRVGSGNWSQVFGNQVIRSFVLTVNGSILAGTQDNGILKSTNQGTTWSFSNSGFLGAYVPSLAILPGGKILAASFERGVHMSTNSGATWSQCNTGLTDTITLPLAVGGSGLILVGTDSKGIFSSTNGGTSWIPSTAGLANYMVTTLARDGVGNIFAGTYSDGVFRSTDAGITWGRQSGDFVGSYVDVLGVSHTNQLYALVGLRRLYCSTNEGGSWLWIPTDTSEFYNDLAVDSSGILFLSSYWAGVARSTDDGLTWTHINNGLGDHHATSIAADEHNVIYVGIREVFGSGSYVFRSEDHGQSWQQTGFVSNRQVDHLAIGSNGYLCAGLHAGVALSTDHGSTWIDVTNNHVGYQVASILMSHAGDIVVSPFYHGVSLLQQPYNSWQDLASGFDAQYALSLLLLPSGHLIAGTPNGVFRSNGSITSVMHDGFSLPLTFWLQQNYPNPFNPTTRVKFEIPHSSFVTIKVFDLLGREVATLVNEEMSPGTYEKDIHMDGFASGVYFYRLQSGEYTFTKRMLLLK